MQELIIQPTGIAALDALLQGGIPEGHVVLVKGKPGTGKTILAMQWLFEGWNQYQQAGLYITATEPITKATRYVKQLDFYQAHDHIRFCDLRTILQINDISEEVTKEDIESLLTVLEQMVKDTGAQRIVIDSVTALAHQINDYQLIRYFIFRLGTLLAQLHVTTFLLAEDDAKDAKFTVQEFISDAVMELSYVTRQQERVRKLDIAKMRGVGFQEGSTIFRITKAGIHLFVHEKQTLTYDSSTERISTGVPGLDAMMGRGIFAGSSTLIAGSTGAGKTVLGLHYLREGLQQGERCLFIGFEESKQQLLRTASSFSWDLSSEHLLMLCTYPKSKHLQEHLSLITQTIKEHQPTRIVIDSLSSIENAFPPEEVEQFFSELTAFLKVRNIASFITSSTSTLMGGKTITDSHLSMLTDNIIMMRYFEQEGSLKSMIAVVKTRGTDHDKALHTYDITAQGIIIGDAISSVEGILTGSAKRVDSISEQRLMESVGDLQQVIKEHPETKEYNTHQFNLD